MVYAVTISVTQVWFPPDVTLPWIAALVKAEQARTVKIAENCILVLVSKCCSGRKNADGIERRCNDLKRVWVNDG